MIVLDNINENDFRKETEVTGDLLENLRTELKRKHQIVFFMFTGTKMTIEWKGWDSYFNFFELKLVYENKVFLRIEFANVR